MTSPNPRYMSLLRRQQDVYVNPHVHQMSSSLHNNAAASKDTTRSPPVSMPSSGSPILPSRSFHADTIEGRLLSLLQQHQAHGAALWAKRLDALGQHVNRVRFLDEHQEQFLRFVQDRSRRFLRNIEELMTEASSGLVAVDSGVLRTVSSSWESAKAFVERAGKLLVASGHAPGSNTTSRTGDMMGSSGGVRRTTSAVSSPPSLKSIHMPHRVLTTDGGGGGVSSRRHHHPSTPPRWAQSSAVQEERDVSSSAGRLPQQDVPVGSASPSTLFNSGDRKHGVHSKLLLHRPGEVPLSRSGELPLSTRKDLLETIEAIGFGCAVAGALTGDAMTEAKQCFSLLYGSSDGHRRFMKWCDEQTLHLMRTMTHGDV